MDERKNNKMNNDLERQYLKRLGDGDHEAFDLLFTTYYAKLKSYLYGFIKNEELAQDMTQDIFFKVWTQRETISRVDSFQSYLFRMAKNMIYDHYDHTYVKEKYDDKVRETTTEWSFDPVEEELFAKELSLLIDMAVEKMPPQRKRIFTMSRKEGFSNEEIAIQLQLSKKTVENHITQALQEIRRFIFTTFLFFF